MTYSTGSTIIDDDYNIFATGNAAGTGDDTVANINTIWGSTGDGAYYNYNYGQTSTVSPVSAGNTITATQWATLLTRMTSIANHQGTTITAISNPSTGDTISAYAALSSNITSIYNNRLNAASVGTDLTTNGTTQTTSTWDVSAVAEQTFTFADFDSARYFFNSGGQIRLSYSLTGGSDAKSLEWADLLTKTGTIVICGFSNSHTVNGETLVGTTKIGGSGTHTIFGSGGFLSGISTTYTQLFKQFADSAPYTANYIEIVLKQNQASTPNTWTIKTNLIDAAADTIAPDGSGSGDALDVVDGTLTMTAVIRPPSTTYISNTWGTPTMSAASWVLSS